MIPKGNSPLSALWTFPSILFSSFIIAWAAEAAQFLMSQGLVDEMQYNETGNEVRLVKRFPVKAHLRTSNGASPKAEPGA